MKLSIIVASSGRPTLTNTLESISHQTKPGDELLLSVNDDQPWGHGARQQLQAKAAGDVLLFMDDDDMYVAGAFDAIRAAVEPHPSHVHIFKMRYPDGRVLWRDQRVECGNVSTQMICVPNRQDKLGKWGDRYEGDFDFLNSTLFLVNLEPIWHDDVIALIRP